MSTKPEHRYSSAEYLVAERASESKSEFLDGVIYAMGGASAAHVLINGNVARELGNRLRDKPCVVYASDLRVRAGAEGLYAYPDVVVVCDDAEFTDSELDTLANPLLIVEGLSKSTKNYDRGEKFERYRSIASFREYLLIAQDKVHVERYEKQSDGTWVLSETNDLDDIIRLASVKCEIAVAEIYFKVRFEDPGMSSQAAEQRE